MSMLRSTAALRAAATLVLAAAVVAGCSSSAAGRVPGSPAPAGEPDAATLAATAAACLRQHGISVPDPSVGPNGQPEWDYPAMGQVPPSVRQSATQACAAEVAAAESAAGPGPLAAGVAAGVRYAACMRQHGLPTFPDPNPSNGQFTGASAFWDHGISPQSPAFKQANQACKTQLAAWKTAAGAGG